MVGGGGGGGGHKSLRPLYIYIHVHPGNINGHNNRGCMAQPSGRPGSQGSSHAQRPIWKVSSITDSHQVSWGKSLGRLQQSLGLGWHALSSWIRKCYQRAQQFFYQSGILLQKLYVRQGVVGGDVRLYYLTGELYPGFLASHTKQPLVIQSRVFPSECVEKDSTKWYWLDNSYSYMVSGAGFCQTYEMKSKNQTKTQTISWNVDSVDSADMLAWDLLPNVSWIHPHSKTVNIWQAAYPHAAYAIQGQVCTYWALCIANYQYKIPLPASMSQSMK